MILHPVENSVKNRDKYCIKLKVTKPVCLREMGNRRY